MLPNIFLMTMQVFVYLIVYGFFIVLLMPGLARKNFAEAGCSFIRSMSRIQGRWLYNSEFLLFFAVCFFAFYSYVASVEYLVSRIGKEHKYLFVLCLFQRGHVAIKNYYKTNFTNLYQVEQVEIKLSS